VKELAVTAAEMNDLLKSSNELLGSPEWDRRIQQVSRSADERMKVAAGQSQLLMNEFFRRTYVALAVVCAMLILCLLSALLLMRRLRIVAGNAGKPRQESGDEAGPGSHIATSARGAGGKGMSE
jgi:hypothetical protein